MRVAKPIFTVKVECIVKQVWHHLLVIKSSPITQVVPEMDSVKLVLFAIKIHIVIIIFIKKPRIECKMLVNVIQECSSLK